MPSRKKPAADQVLASRHAADGVSVSFMLNDAEVTLSSVDGEITPNNEAEARALAQFSDEALNPAPSSASDESVQAPGGDDDAGPDQEGSHPDDDAGEPGQEDQA